MRSAQNRVLGMAGWLLVTYAAAAIGGLASARSGTFYQQLSRPDWAPPPSVFGPVWTILYLLMAIAAWLVWRDRGFARAGGALGLYLVQLAANALWTWLFFAWQMGSMAFLEILVLWVLIVATIVAFWRIRRSAGLLMLPYLAWVTFAAMLTYSIWQRNPDVLG